MKKYVLDAPSYDKLEQSFLKERVEKIIDDGALQTVGMVYQDDVQSRLRDLKHAGYFENIPEEVRSQYTETIETLCTDPQEKEWIIDTHGDKKVIPCSTDDALLTSGYFPSKVLSPKEFWTVFRDIGFENPLVFLEALSLYILEKKKNIWVDKRVYGWEYETPDKRNMYTRMDKNTHLDSWITREDKTPYPTQDPFGNTVQMRPAFSQLQEGIYLKQDGETLFLEVLLQYAEEISETKEQFKDRIQEVITWIEDHTTEEERNGVQDVKTNNNFLYFTDSLNQKEIPTDDSSDEIKKQNFVIPAFQGKYFVRKNKHNHLLLLNEKDRIVTTLYPEEVEHFLKGIAQQSFNHLVRSPIHLLYDLFRYRISDEFENERYE